MNVQNPEKSIFVAEKQHFLLKMSNTDAMLLSASIIATWASVDYSVENRVLKVKKSRNLDFGQKVKNDFDLHICCHGNDLTLFVTSLHS